MASEIHKRNIEELMKKSRRGKEISAAALLFL